MFGDDGFGDLSEFAKSSRIWVEDNDSRQRERVEKLERQLSDLGCEVVFESSHFWALDIHHDRYLQEGFLATFDKELRRVNKAEASVSWWMSRSLMLEEILNFLGPSETEKFRANPSYAVVVSAVVLLSFVYQYLTVNVGRGGSRAYSRSSLDFRDIYIAIVLFLGAYVWIKFREVAFKGVYTRESKDQEGRITKKVYEPRFKPPRENGSVFERIYLGQYATPKEASILYRIAAFYYNEDQCSLLDLEDGRSFPIPPMSEGERSLTGLEKRAWVKVQAMKVYEEFKKEKAEAALVQELLKVCADGVPQERDEGLADSNGQSLGSPEGPAMPISQLPSNTENGMGICSSNQLDLLQTLVRTQQELITYQQQQISLQQQELQDCRAQISELKQQHYFQQLLQDINGRVPSNEVEMEQSLHLKNQCQSLMTQMPFAGAEAQEAFI